jgi:hypothetical protein
MQLDEMKELLELDKGKQWDAILKSVFLVLHYQNEIDFAGFYKLGQEEQKQVMQIIAKGQHAHEVLDRWIKPLNNGEILEAIKTAKELKIGNGEYDDFEVLKFGEITGAKNAEPKGFKIYEHILEVDDPALLVEYFKQQKPETNLLIVTVAPNNEFEYKFEINVFLIWKNTVYALNMGERRLNVHNIAGERNPARYIERTYDRIWPIYEAVKQKGASESTEIELKKRSIRKGINIAEYLKKDAEASIWTEMFMLRAIDYLENAKDEIPQGFTPAEYMKMLPDKSAGPEEIAERVKIEDHSDSFASINDASSYLLNKYRSKITSIVPAANTLPKVMGTVSHIEAMIKYQQRDNVAKQLEDQVWKDYNENSARVYKWFKDFVLSKNPQEIVKLALEGKSYEYMQYPTGIHSREKPKLVAESLVRLAERFTIWGSDPREVICTDNGHLYGKEGNAVLCQNCKKFAWKLLLQIAFKDYRQVAAFFGMSENELPKEFVEHFHWQNESYVGNFIISDTDPVDEIKDPWFRDVFEPVFGDDKTLRADGQPKLEIYIPLCIRCIRAGKVGADFLEKEPFRNPSLSNKERILNLIELRGPISEESMKYYVSLRKNTIEKILDELKVENRIERKFAENHGPFMGWGPKEGGNKN